MGLSCLYMINLLLSTFCLFVWQCLANLKELVCNSTWSTLGIPSGASSCCRSSRLLDVMLSHGEDKTATNGVTNMGPERVISWCPVQIYTRFLVHSLNCVWFSKYYDGYGPSIQKMMSDSSKYRYIVFKTS